MIGHLVACIWLDAHGDAKAEFGLEEIALSTSYKFTTYGILVRDDREREGLLDRLVAVAAECGADGRYRGVTFIPAGMVVEVQDLGLPKPKRTRGKRSSPGPRSVLGSAPPAGGQDCRVPQ